MNVSHFFHLYAAGEWQDAVAEHMAALEDGGYDGPFHVGVVGSAEQRADALEELHWLRPPDSVTEAKEGWEQVTLAALREHAKRQRTGTILYAHTKGAANSNIINITWRRAMSHHVVKGWKQCAEAIATGEYDAVGCHWLTPDEFPGVVETPFFGGTFWMATTAYLRKLPPCATDSRHDAEMWIGLRNPRVLDLSPGWPGNYGAMPRYRRLIAGRG